MKDSIITKENEYTVGNQNPGSLSNPDTANSVDQKTEVGIVDDDQLKNVQEVEQSKEHALGRLKETNLDYRITAEEHEPESYNQSQNFLLNFDIRKNGQLDSTHTLISSDSFGQSTETGTIKNDKGLTNVMNVIFDMDGSDEQQEVPPQEAKVIMIPEEAEAVSYSESQDSQSKHDMDIYELERTRDFSSSFDNFGQLNAVGVSDDVEPRNHLEIETSTSHDLQLQETNFEQSQPQIMLPVLPDTLISDVVVDYNLEFTGEIDLPVSVEQQDVPPEEGNLDSLPLAGSNVMNVIVVAAECTPWSKTGIYIHFNFETNLFDNSSPQH